MSVWSDNPPKTDNLTELRRWGKFPGTSTDRLQPICLVTIRLLSPVCLIEKIGHGTALAYPHIVAKPCETEMDYEASRRFNSPFFPPDVMGAFSHNPKHSLQLHSKPLLPGAAFFLRRNWFHHRGQTQREEMRGWRMEELPFSSIHHLDAPSSSFSVSSVFSVAEHFSRP
jgi:hypothetical protein